MTLAQNTPAAAAAGPSGPGGSDVAPDAGSVAGPGPGPGTAADPASDPLFHAEEPVERPVRRGTLVLQFFLVPLLIVVGAVGIFLFFGMLAGGKATPAEHLEQVRTGSDSVQRQAAHQLGVLLKAERERVDARRDPDTPPFWAEPGFREGLARAFVDSFPDKSVERRQFLALALGKVGDPELLPVLADHAGPTAAGKPNPVAVRYYVVSALGDLRTDRVVPALAGVLRDAKADDEEPLRALAVVALSRRDTPASREALRFALERDASAYVRAEAGAALARFGDPAGADEVARLLDESWVRAQVERRPASGRDAAEGSTDRVLLRRAFLANGLRGALGLKDERFRERVEALARDGDEEVRRLARDVLDRWPRA
jgi:HEAT repeat protein